MDINRRNVVVTGAASGIGLAILQELVNYGCKIIAADRNSANLEGVVFSHADQVIPFVGDIAIPEQVDQLFAFALKSLGSIDIFIANAGYAYYEQLKEADWSHLEQIFRVNTLSPIYSLLKMNQLNPDKPWKVVMVSSAAAEWPVPGYTVYGATKAAIQQFAEGYRFDHSTGNLLVVYPIATNTRFFETAGIGIPRAFPVQEASYVARKVVRGILHDKRTVHPSLLFSLILLINRFLPFIKPLYQAFENKKFKNWLKSGSI
jgi:uncharacterized protein